MLNVYHLEKKHNQILGVDGSHKKLKFSSLGEAKAKPKYL